MCPSYPHAVIVPKAVDDETLVKAAAFRMGGRFPVFSFFHRESRVTETDSAASDWGGGECLVWYEGLAGQALAHKQSRISSWGGGGGAGSKCLMMILMKKASQVLSVGMN